MVFEIVVERAIDAHGARSGVVGHCARDGAAGGLIYFVDSTHVNGLAVIWLDLFHEIAIAIIDKLCGLSTHRDRDQAVLPIGDASQSASRA